MKKIIILFFAFICSCTCMAQFKFSGTAKGAKAGDSINVNIPFIYGYYRENDHKIAVDNAGKFSVVLPVSEQKFATLEYRNLSTTLLLTPGKNLTITLDTAGNCRNFSGTSAIENKLLYQVKITQVPFFNKPGSKNNIYATMPPAEMQQKMIKPWQDTIAKRLTLIEGSTLPVVTKKLIAQEVRSAGVTQLNYFSRGIIDRSNRGWADTMRLNNYKDLDIAPQVFPAGPQYYYFADQYIGHLELQAFMTMRLDKQKGEALLQKFYHFGLDSGNRLAKEKGQVYMNWIAVKNNEEPRVAEAYLAQSVAARCSEKELTQAKPLMAEFETTYPKSKYMRILKAKMARLNALLEQNKNNPKIKIADGYDKVTSIYQTISQLKGKVVYLDIWGTWCGPCKEELTYNPELKSYFKGKDVAFVYLDMDEDAKDAQWKEFIKVNGMTGLHLRKNSNDIQQFWKELMTDQSKHGFYPTYFIFNKDGKLVTEGAKRPSDKEELYRQIEKYL